MQRSHAERAYTRTVAPARLEKHRFFIGFTFKGSTDLEALAGFYGLIVPELEPGITLAEYLARTCHGILRPGYRIAFGNAALVVREIGEGTVQKVGLRFLPIAPHEHRRQRPHGKAYNIAVAASRTGRRESAGVADLPR